MSNISTGQIRMLLDLETRAKILGFGFGAEFQCFIEEMKLKLAARHRLQDHQLAVRDLLRVTGGTSGGAGSFLEIYGLQGNQSFHNLNDKEAIPVENYIEMETLLERLSIRLSNVHNRYLNTLAVKLIPCSNYWIEVCDTRHNPDAVVDGLEEATLREALMYFIQCRVRLKASVPLYIYGGRFSFFLDEDSKPTIVYHGKEAVEDHPCNLFVKRHIIR